MSVPPPFQDKETEAQKGTGVIHGGIGCQYESPGQELGLWLPACGPEGRVHRRHGHQAHFLNSCGPRELQHECDFLPAGEARWRKPPHSRKSPESLGLSREATMAIAEMGRERERERELESLPSTQ